ncbi:MAG TPA: 16S rRNA (guanine(527)-N(7))-methyltransferase RsmG [Thermoleophilaceae bacterium]
MSVSRETVEATVRRFDVPDPAATTATVQALLDALAAEPDPPTTVREPAEALDGHIADSLSGLVVPGLRSAKRIVDLGAGAGFPGLALAAALPDAHVALVESTRRKCEVIDRLAVAAGLDARTTPVAVRAEDLAREGGAIAYDAATARALASLPVICEYAAPLLRIGGVLVAWKGARNDEEEAAGGRAASGLGLSDPQVLPVSPFAGTNARHLYVYSKISETPARYPRRAGLAAKRPLG